MGRPVYSMIESVDGYVCDANGDFDWGVADEEMHSFIAAQFRSVGTCLYGRRMYETMVVYLCGASAAAEDRVRA